MSAASRRWTAVEVRPRVSGYVQAIGIPRRARTCARSQLLFVIDPRPYQAALDQARAQVARAQATLANARLEADRSQKLL